MLRFFPLLQLSWHGNRKICALTPSWEKKLSGNRNVDKGFAILRCLKNIFFFSYNSCELWDEDLMDEMKYMNLEQNYKKNHLVAWTKDRFYTLVFFSWKSDKYNIEEEKKETKDITIPVSSKIIATVIRISSWDNKCTLAGVGAATWSLDLSPKHGLNDATCAREKRSPFHCHTCGWKNICSKGKSRRDASKVY